MKKNLLFFPVDWATIIYLLVLSLIILFFKHNQPFWHYYLIFNFSIVVFILIVVKFLSFPNEVAGFIRHWYPVILFTFLYEETRYLVHIIFPGFFDFRINNLEFNLLGNYPTVFLGKYSIPILNEYFLLAYFSYYFLLPVSGIALYFGKKIKEFDRMVFTSAIAFYISYLGFIFFPVEGPRYALSAFHKIPIKGFIFVPLTQWIVKVGGLHGGCMPSSHVAVACVVFVFSYRYIRELFYFFGPLIISLFIGTVWGRFHYFSDVLAGIIVGLLSLYLVEKIEHFREMSKDFNSQEKDILLDLIEKK